MRALIISSIVLLTMSIPAAAAENAAGHWEGTAEVPGLTLRLIVDLSNDHAKWYGWATLPDFSVAEAPVADIVSSGNDLSFTIPEKLGGLKFKGSFDASANLAGQLQQEGNNARLVLHRTGDSQWQPPKPPRLLPKEYEGEWSGDAKLPTRTANIHVVLANKDGAPSVQFRLGTQDLPAMAVAMEDPFLTIKWPQAGVRVEGQLNKDKDEIEASWNRMGFHSSFVLRRVQKEKP